MSNLNKEDVVEIHKRLEELYLCREGILKEDLLDSAIAGQRWYDSIFDKYAHVASSINCSHIFVDGNKRTCVVIMRKLSEYRYFFDEAKLTRLILSLASSEITKEEFMSRAKDCLL